MILVMVVQGSNTFSKMKFMVFSEIYQGQNYIFQALLHRYLVHWNCFILWWNTLQYTTGLALPLIENYLEKCTTGLKNLTLQILFMLFYVIHV